MNKPIIAIKIIRTPAGEAPDDIRQAWVGLVLPQAIEIDGVGFEYGVLSGPKNLLSWYWWKYFGKKTRAMGYAVDAVAAVEILERSNPRAARWWKDHASHNLRSRHMLLFKASECELVDPHG